MISHAQLCRYYNIIIIKTNYEIITFNYYFCTRLNNKTYLLQKKVNGTSNSTKLLQIRMALVMYR